MYICILFRHCGTPLSEDVLVLCTTVYCRTASAVQNLFCVQSLVLYTVVLNRVVVVVCCCFSHSAYWVGT